LLANLEVCSYYPIRATGLLSARIEADFVRPWNKQNYTRTTPLPPKTGEAGFDSGTGAGAFKEKVLSKWFQVEGGYTV
jgi:hypothetical protein